MKKIKKIILFSLIIISSTAYAQQSYTLLVPLPGLGNAQGQTTLAQYIPGIFTLSIAIAAALAFVMITFGGITYATSDAITGKQKGRELVTNAIYGLILVIGAYAILYTINPNFLTFNIDTRTPQIALQPSVTATSTPGVAPCTGCVTIASVNPEIPTKTRPMWASPTLANRLSRVQDYMGGFPWQVNEAATSAAGIHVNGSCHDRGICADIVPLDRQNPAAINSVFAGLSSAGFSSITFEVMEPLASDDIQRLIRGCTTSSCTPQRPPLDPRIRIVQNLQANGWHFHAIQ